MTDLSVASRQHDLTFPEGFVWGAATSAYQIEGAAHEDGRGASIWDVFARTPGAIAGGHTGDTACDHYHRYAEDVALMRELGLGAYRFSVAWPRIQPEGHGAPNPAGLDFYERLVDALLAAGIEPYPTLYHWDLPQALQERGGWESRDTARRFADYTEHVRARLGDRVRTWTTLNEPWVAAILGYGLGLHAPGVAAAASAFRAAHHLLLAHGLGASVLRAGGAREVALTLNLSPVLTPRQLGEADAPLGDADRGAVARIDALLNRQFLEPVLRGRYPDEVLRIVERHAGLDHIRDGDLETIHAPVDVLGVNYYSPCVVRARPGAAADPAYPGSEGIAFEAAQAPTTALGWSIVPDGLTVLLRRLARDYPGAALVVTENGAAFDDTVQDGRIHDVQRTAYIEGHLRAAHAAIQAGVDLRGYLVWSLLDNFEWAEGYGRRFGIVHVDFSTQRRAVKDSGHWYREVVRRHGLPPAPPRRPTLEVVAAHTGLSRSTVSRVINGEASVSPRARDRVMRAVQELGYVPNSAARSLVTRRADAVALVISDPSAEDTDDPVFATITRAVGHEMEGAGKQLTLVLTHAEADIRRIQHALDAGHVDGVLLVAMRQADPLLLKLGHCDVPVVSLGRPAHGLDTVHIDADNAAGAAAAVNHLLSAGRRRIAFIGGPGDIPSAQDRCTAYRDTLAGAGRQPVTETGDFTRASGAAAMRRLLRSAPDVDAVFAASDLMALGALHTLRSAGRRVPDDVAVVGFDDIEAAAYAVPPLTTVRQPVAELARETARLLLRRIGGEAARSAVLPTTLVVRESA